MKNSMNLIVLLFLILLVIFLPIRGITIGDLQILSISQIKEKNEELEEKINTASSLATIQYEESVDNLEKSFDDYIIQKEKYEEITELMDNKSEVETKEYDISYLWRVIGKYATDNKLRLNLDVKISNQVGNLYNFYFTAWGEYVKISEFIKDIENDSNLFFRIHDFTMKEMKDDASGMTVISTFVVKDIRIKTETIQ